jgi:hypothetical protein
MNNVLLHPPVPTVSCLRPLLSFTRLEVLSWALSRLDQQLRILAVFPHSVIRKMISLLAPLTNAERPAQAVGFSIHQRDQLSPCPSPCSMLHAPCSMLHAPCSMLHAPSSSSALPHSSTMGRIAKISNREHGEGRCRRSTDSCSTGRDTNHTPGICEWSGRRCACSGSSLR